MLSPDEFREEYPPERLDDELPDTPITSLRTIQYLYGKLYTLATAGGGTYGPYLTPDEAGDLIDTDDSLIVVRVDLSGEQPVLATDGSGPIEVTRYSADLVERVGHCKYPAAAGIDHSITHQAGRNSDPEKLARYAKERLTKWATDPVVQEASGDHEDGWIVEALATLGEDDDALDRIEDELTTKLGGESTTALLTVRVKTEPDGEYQWPGDLDVFKEAMRQRKLSKLVTKNKADDSSGEATDLVTGQRTRTVGTSEDPQNYFLGKQLEKFPGLDIEEAWRTHSISEDAAVTVMNAETFVEACKYPTFGAKVYYLPYFFGRASTEEIYELYNLLYQATTEDDDLTPVEKACEDFQDQDDTALRFYVSAVMPHQMSRYDVFGETLNGRLLYPRDLARHHNRIVSDTSAFNTDTDWSAPLPTNENWGLLTADDEALHSVSSGWYFYQTFAERDDEEADADDPRIEALVSVLGGDAIAVETLLSEYVDRIIADEDDDDLEGFPSFRVASQFAQLCALATETLDLLTTDDPGKRPITIEPDYEVDIMESLEDIQIIPDGGHPAAPKLESFIEDTPAIARTSNADEVLDEADAEHRQSVRNQRRGAFMLGALVGEVGSYQEYSEDRSTTLVDQFPVKSITQSRVKKVTREAIGKTLTYTRQEKKSGGSFPGTKFEHVVEELRKTIVKPDPDDWDIDTEDLRFYYALGVTYGLNDHPEWDNQADDTEEDI
ncbi:type I-B CRISPR-associated protein Cas8b/Csh1 [Halorhabdus sp. CBA1104]|uniref:type I-B CRISPR-associated protein Cas8b/Csh1 n=1 Tax=Halorhabdus sp. CBA1104 TaxID=1380432 RepID=UPI0012B2DB95|nr:type I-B CRISPR-associated protein Cas8b/Csh1 [Halorhabdus sp. CBA1104]QGN07720.1 type I-B CRISPR-associated protein Cas8b/Csh1 [Halorhabdus sp. CBA1104]